jgi:hypothetical protein
MQQYIAALFEHWYVLISTGIFTLIGFAAYSRWKNWVGELTVAVSFLMLLYASYLPWRDERRRVDQLVAHLSEIQPLTLDQERRMVETLSPGRGRGIQLHVFPADRTVTQFAERIRGIFHQAGWGVSGNGGGGQAAEAHGLRVMAQDINSEDVDLITKAFHAGGLQYQFLRACDGPTRVVIGDKEWLRAK